MNILFTIISMFALCRIMFRCLDRIHFFKYRLPMSACFKFIKNPPEIRKIVFFFICLAFVLTFYFERTSK
jgi:hypothetical protein